MGNNWLCNVDPKLKPQILVGVSTLCWVIWLIRNDIISEKSKVNFYM
uniref:Uncharacterized protein n=1 Tax=Arundo donax TaxID=35708 RepID=A0A0A9AJS6_ARUDO